MIKKCNKSFDWNGAEMSCIRWTFFNWHYGCCQASITNKKLNEIMNDAFDRLDKFKQDMRKYENRR